MPRTRPLQRPLLSLGSAFGVGLASITLLGPSANADPAAVPGPVAITATGAYAGTVPGGVCAVQAEVLGGAGGHNVIGGGVSAANANGGGARIVATYSVLPGMSYSGTVGGGGKQAPDSGIPGSGGVNGGGDGGVVTGGLHPGSGGGGWSSLGLGGTEVIVAGGGGGSGGGHSLNGGFGGDAGLPGAPGTPATGSPGTPARDTVAGNVVGAGSGGGPGAPGTGGTNPNTPAKNGVAGSGRDGGDGGADSDPDSGGGGGGGYFGGGGGASTVGNGTGAPVLNGIGGGGGGGGASFVAATSPDGTGSAVSGLASSVGPKRAVGGPGADGAVTLTWIPCDYDLAVTKSVSPDSAPVGDTVTWTVTVENLGPDPMTQDDLVTLSDTLPGAGAKTITGISTSGGSNSAGLARGSVTCSAGVGAAMPATLTCSRPYSAPSAPGAPNSGNRGLDPGETLTVTYTQVVPGPIGATLTNTASVTDRAIGDSNDSAGATLTVTAVPPVANPDISDGPQGVPQSVDPLTNDTPSGPGAAIDPDSLTLLDSGGNPVASVTIPGQGTYTINGAGEIVFTPLPAFTGEADPVTYQVADVNGTTATSTYTPTVNPVTPVANPNVSSGPQGSPQSVDPLGNDDPGDPLVPLDPDTLTLLNGAGNPVASVTVPGQGVYTINGAGEIVFTPEPGFVGEADPVDYRVADVNGTTTTSTYTPTVTPVTAPDNTTGPQGVPQSVNPLTNDTLDPGVTLVPATLQLIDPDTGDPVASVTIPGQGTYTVSGTLIVFTPLPDFTGPADPITYQVEDTDGNLLQDTYSPIVTPVTPIANPDTSSGPQGQPQSVDPLANDEPGDDAVPLDPDSLTLLDAGGDPAASVTIPGQGTYTINGAGEIVFTPLPEFVGEADPVTYQVADVNGTTATSTYTPTVTPVTPVANPNTSSGPQGSPQSVDPLGNDDPGDPSVPLDPDTLTLLNGAGDPVASVTVPGQGVYTINGAGRIVFTPEPGFVGTADPVDYRVADVNGTTTTSTYTPTVTPVTAPDTTSGPQGVPQSVNPLANDTLDPSVTLVASTLQLIDPDTGDPVASVTIPGQGTYTINGANRIVFTPLPDFIGTADPVTYQVEDTSGNLLQDTYTPTLTPVAPEANPDETSGLQGLPQSINPLANDDPGDPSVPLDPDSLTLLDAGGNPVASVTLPGQGVYTINGSGRIVFTPEPDFTGTADSVDYRVADVNGTTATSTYTPTVTPVAPEANPDTTSGPQGRPQSVDPLANDNPGDPSVPLDPDTLTLLDGAGDPVASVTVPGEGVYTINGAGEIVFTPEPGFTGTATPVTYQIADVNGTATMTTYTPTVTPVAPDANPDKTRGPINKPQSVNPFDNDVAGDPAVPLDHGSLTLLDADGNPVDTVVVPGQGTYTVKGEKIVFTPVHGFTGKADPVTYQIADVNGTTATSTYTPTIEAGPPVVIVIPETAPQGSTVVLDPAADIPGLDPTTVELIDPETGEHVTTLVVPGEGTWTVDPVTGEVTFVPEDGFEGDPTPVKFVGTKYNGQRVHGTLRIHYFAPGLPDTGASPWLLPATGLALVLIGGGFLMIRRARRTE